MVFIRSDDMRFVCAERASLLRDAVRVSSFILGA
jgi:hypothetical protein